MIRARPPRLAPLAVVSGLALAACSGDPVSEEERGPRLPPARAAATAASPTAQALFDAEGNLLESDEVVAGLRLPRGLSAARTEPRLRVYTSQVATEKVARYFGARLLTGQVTRVGRGALFRAAEVRNARGSSVKLDVSVLAGSAAPTRVEIRELPPVPEHPLSDREVRELLEKARNE